MIVFLLFVGRLPVYSDEDLLDDQSTRLPSEPLFLRKNVLNAIRWRQSQILQVKLLSGLGRWRLVLLNLWNSDQMADGSNQTAAAILQRCSSQYKQHCELESIRRKQEMCSSDSETDMDIE